MQRKTQTFQVSTSAEGWKEKCKELAETGREFHLLGYEMEHFHFCEELCKNYGYILSCRIEDAISSTMTFRPKGKAAK